MALDGTYDPDNIFAKILRGEAPCVKLFEDDHAFAFMDVFPQSKGHCLVIPKHGHARNFLDVEPQVIGPLMEDVQRLARAVRAALKPDGIRIMQFNGAPSGQTVFHLHVHIIPVYAGVPLGRHADAGGMADLQELKVLAGQIAAQIS